MEKRKTILKESVVLLIAAILVLTAMVITGQPTQMIKKANYTATWLSSAKTNIPDKAGISYLLKSDNPMRPLSTDWIHYDSGSYDNAVSAGGGTFQWAIRLTPIELNGYVGLTTVKFYLGYSGTALPPLHGSIYVYEQGTDTTPGARIDTATTPWEHTGSSDWVEIPLANSVSITDPPQDLWLSVEIDSSAWGYPAGVDFGPAVDGKGDWIYLEGAWSELQTYGLDYNWHIWAGVTANTPPNPPSNPNPVDGTVICACDPPCLTWTRGTDPDTGDSVHDEVYLSDDLTPPYPDHYVATLSSSDPPQYCLASLTDGLTYKWQIVEIDNHGESTPGPVWSFTTTTSSFSVAVAVDAVTKNMIDVTITNIPRVTINNVKVWINFTITGSPAPCVSPNLQYGLIGGGILGANGIYYWGPKSINKNGKLFTVIIKGGYAYFDITVTVNSCQDSTYKGVTQVIKHGCICDLTIC